MQFYHEHEGTCLSSSWFRLGEDFVISLIDLSCMIAVDLGIVLLGQKKKRRMLSEFRQYYLLIYNELR